ncbi:SbcC/MukB-like Walker B domain-containing protein [Alteromonas sp. a30]|uniref:SbcC/MukB-like Walker B domain-containing protein n=1 Tax=Alteromonas sp. a30 TaxID=2730917 RepID=UPI002282C5CD|nr:SbcC/MukB-like Walker B domain-containing protein [Alteromonas sp. a30]MCY7296235.1 hypothetical protein [Alteromonas sp. a30]
MMKQLSQLTLVQFYLHEAEDIIIDGSTAFLGPNGCGKSTTLDAIQTIMVGGNQNYSSYNAQLISGKNKRKLSGYCLGLLRNPEDGSHAIKQARDEARTYLIAVFSDGTEQGTLSAGLCVEADNDSDKHELKGLFILPGQRVSAKDCLVIDGDNERPIEYAEFKENHTQIAKEIGRTPTFTDSSNEYVKELLYALYGARMPEPKKFMATFVKAMTLKDVDSIDMFVRNFVVESNPVDIADFQKQVEQFINLKALISQTKERIGKLDGILKDYKTAVKSEGKIATYEAIGTIFALEAQLEKLDDVEEEIERLNETLNEAERQFKSFDEQYSEKSDEVNQLKIALESDGNEQLKLRLEESISANKRIIAANQYPEVSRANRHINALREIENLPHFGILQNEIKSIINALNTGRNQSAPSEAVKKAFTQLTPKLNAVEKAISAQFSLLTQEEAKLEREKTDLANRITAAKQTGRLLGEGSATLLALLNANGIDASPLSALCALKDETWAPAIESYLGDVRDALVVTDGSTVDAVRLLRQARRDNENVRGASIVQPEHLRDIDTRYRGREYAVDLFECENDTAKKLLWLRLNTIRLVETEEELAAHPRAITKDGMLSQGGLTKSINIKPVTDLRIGRSALDTSYLAARKTEAEKELETTRRSLTLINKVKMALADKGNEQDRTVSEDIEKAKKDIVAAEIQLKGINISHLDTIREKAAVAASEAKVLQTKRDHALTLKSGLTEQITHKENNKVDLEKVIPDLKEREKATLNNPLVMHDIMDVYKDEIETRYPQHSERVDALDEFITRHKNKLIKATDNANNALTAYVDSLQFNNVDWHERHAWTIDERERLFGTRLHKYEKEAEQARKASEETLRTDIAMSLYDRFKEMELDRKALNRILESCPAFTGDERYRFTASVVKRYDALVKHIEEIATSEEGFSLLSPDAAELDSTLKELIEEAAESGSTNTVLDYRNFYTFDLDILVRGKRVDRMSNRQGSGSNGEHIAPMYVAAGAALAKAYRLQNHKDKAPSSGIICLDEAFHGMDTTNAIATAKFLQSIGLQLIMAGPETERNKLSPMTQTIYDLDREELHLDMIRTKFKAKANQLMTSDLPDENPQVMKDAFAQLGFTELSESVDIASAGMTSE